MPAIDHPLIDRFLEMMAAERGASRNTLLAYRTDLQGAGEIVGGLAAASQDALGRLAGEWAPLAASTVARKASALRAFYGQQVRMGLRGQARFADMAFLSIGTRLTGD
mgnify:CR=1 FL=1